MNDETLAALRGSIAKWEAIVAGTGVDLGPGNCPLCKVFYHKNCASCPVRIRTGEIECEYTPYRDWDDWWYAWWDDYGYDDCLLGDLPEKDRQEARSLAQAELDFLRSLLPPGVAP